MAEHADALRCILIVAAGLLFCNVGIPLARWLRERRNRD